MLVNHLCPIPQARTAATQYGLFLCQIKGLPRAFGSPLRDWVGPSVGSGGLGTKEPDIKRCLYYCVPDRRKYLSIVVGVRDAQSRTR